MSQPVYSAVGDSITAAYGSWFDRYCWRRTYGAVRKNHAVGGASIITDADGDDDLATQVGYAATDGANKFYIAMGVNDVDGGNMTTLRTVYETNIQSIKSTNPNAEIICLNAWPVWYDAGGGNIQPQSKDNIRAAISLACSNQGVQCIDTSNINYGGVTYSYTLTSDYVHPNDTGKELMVNWLMANYG